MKILMLSWEYPPKNIGGISNHVYYLSHALSNLGHEVHVVTCGENNAPYKEIDNGVFVHRVEPFKIFTDDFIKWVMHLNFAMIEETTKLINKIGRVDIIHAHDWLTVYAAKSLKNSFKIPMVSTIHATENGRNKGIKTEMQAYISTAEWLLSFESWKIVGCSNYMKNEIATVFSSPQDKIWVIPNGVDASSFQFSFDWLKFRRNYALDEEKIVLYVGRHVYEKGIQILIESVSEIIKTYSNAKIVIAGKGPMTVELKRRINELNLDDKVLFTGYITEDEKNKLYRVSNVAVFPSLYEPFGIVALEAMAAGCPVVVSDVGGLSEIIEHGRSGMKAIAGSSESLKENICRILSNDGLASYIREDAMRIIDERYLWGKIAETTTEMYKLVLEETKGTEWDNKNISKNECAIDKFDSKMYGMLECALDLDLKNKLENGLKVELNKDILHKLELGLKFNEAACLNNEFETELKDKLRKELEAKLRNQIKAELEDTLSESLKAELEPVLKKELESKLRKKLTRSINKELKNELVNEQNEENMKNNHIEINSIEKNSIEKNSIEKNSKSTEVDCVNNESVKNHGVEKKKKRKKEVKSE